MKKVEKMNNGIYSVLLEYIQKDEEAFNALVNSDNIYGLGTTKEEIIEYLEFTNEDYVLSSKINNNVLITEGDILSVLKIIHDITYYEGKYILYINNDNAAIITYIIKCVNRIFENYNLKIRIKIDYSRNYNDYLNIPVTLIGSEDFVNTARKDFSNAQQIIV